MALVLTCEHASAWVPPAFAHLFRSKAAQRLLRSHLGSDLGAVAFARALQRRTGAPLVAGEVTRLLVELNRSPGYRPPSPAPKLQPDVRAALHARYYTRHHARVRETVAACLARGDRVLHVGVHSFTPVLDGVARVADLALLYDPKRPAERALCAHLRATLREAAPALRIRRNYPYRGDSDGLTTLLRRHFRTGRYLGVELELNQGVLNGASASQRRRLQATLAGALQRAMRR